MDKTLEKILNDINQEILENPGVNLMGEGILDSLSLMKLVATLESAYSFEFDPDDIVPENFESVEAIGKIVAKYMGRD